MSGNGLPLDHLRTLHDGSLTRAEVRILCDEIERLRRGLERVQERHALADDRSPGGLNEYGRGWHDGYITALATCSLIAREHLDPVAWAESEDEWRAGNTASDRVWFERTGSCGHCGNTAAYCCCTDDDPCGCGPHELASEPLSCSWCNGTGIALRPRAHSGRQGSVKPDQTECTHGLTKAAWGGVPEVCLECGAEVHSGRVDS